MAEDIVWGAPQALAAALRDGICHHAVQVGARLSSEQEMAARPAVSRAEYPGGTFEVQSLPDGWASAPCWHTHDLDSPECARLYPSLADKRPGLIVVSGFLGAGKTTFLNNCIE
ncbi:MAG: hypothetical protein ACK5JO_19085, partial [Halodesulfovibrio sp.]